MTRRRTSRAPRGSCRPSQGSPRRARTMTQHSCGHSPDPSPRIKPGAKGVKGSGQRGQGAGESKCCPEELAAWVGHARREEKFCRPV